MPYTCSLSDVALKDQTNTGDKAAHLGELTHAAFDVPRGFCVTADAYRDVVAVPLNDKIIARIVASEIDDPVELESAAEDIRAWIENVPTPDALVDEIRRAMDTLGGKSFAVRASRIVEDVPNPAASGLQQAYLCVVGIDAVLKNIRACWSSPWNSRAIYFRHRKKMEQRQVTMAVVVQPMVDAEASGVMFTANPLTGAGDEIHIDATWGLGEAIIAARWKPDHFVVNNNDLSIRTRTIPTKSVMDVVSTDGTMQTIAVPENNQDAACLTDAQVVELATLGKKVEAHFNRPQDIEWCRVGDKISLLQTRPLKKK
jgi:pyruvate,water dikinase